jgi:Uma2 family endonuclease
MDASRSTDVIVVPVGTRFPVELKLPAGFRPEDATTWPSVDGRLEYVRGRLLFMPPCADTQLLVTGSVAGLLDRWLDQQPSFTFGTNEAGLLLGGEVRGADAAVWKRDALGPPTGRYVRVPPLLVVEVAGRDEDEAALREKARWYHDRGVRVVWVVLPDSREVLVLRPGSEVRCAPGARIPAHPDLPDLEPEVSAFFRRLGSGA